MGIFDNSEESTAQLRKRLFFYLAAALLTLTLGLMMAVSYTLLDRLKAAESHSLSHTAEMRSIAVSEWCRRAKDVAKQITSRTRIRQELEKYNKGEITLQQVDQFTKPKLQDAMNLSSEVLGIMRLDAEDRIITQCGTIPDFNLSGQTIKDYVHDDVTLSKPIALNGPSIIVSAPILNRNGENQGTDLVIISTDLLKNIVTNPTQELGRTSEIIVGYMKNGSVEPLFPLTNHSHHSPAEATYLDDVNMCISKAIKGGAGLIDSTDTAMAYHPIEECDWGIVLTQNEDELYSPVYKRMLIIGGLSMLIYFAILLGFWAMMKPLAGRILLHTDELEKKIQEKTEDLEKEITERKKTEQEKEQIIVELRKAMEEIKTLSGMLPICSNCKKIRDDKGYWSQIESYISHHSEAEFSHGICPECAKELYPDLDIHKD